MGDAELEQKVKMLERRVGSIEKELDLWLDTLKRIGREQAASTGLLQQIVTKLGEEGQC